MLISNNAKFNFPHLFRHEIRMGKLDWQYGDMGSMAALVTLCCLVKSGYEPVFEFGTYRGRTTYNLALNAEQVVTTLDWLGSGDSYKGSIGECFGECKLSEIDILPLTGDSRTFDFSEWHNQMGLVLVDGGHSFETCWSDTQNAFKLIRPGGLIVWDDCSLDWPGVVQAIEKFEAQGHELIMLREEALVVYGLQR